MHQPVGSGAPTHRGIRPARSRGGQTTATVQEAIVHLGGDKFQISVAGDLELTVHDDWLNREFQVKDQAGRVAIVVSRAWSASTTAMGSRSRRASMSLSRSRSALPLSASRPRSRARSHRFQNLLGGIGPF